MTTRKEVAAQIIYRKPMMTRCRINALAVSTYQRRECVYDYQSYRIIFADGADVRDRVCYREVIAMIIIAMGLFILGTFIVGMALGLFIAATTSRFEEEENNGQGNKGNDSADG